MINSSNEAPLELRSIPTASIRLDPNQPRVIFPENARRELTASLLENGQQVPISVTPDGEGYLVVDGARRWMSACDAKLESMLAVVSPEALDEKSRLLRQHLANAHRLDANPLEACDTYLRLMELHGINATGLTKLISKSKTHVSNVLSIAGLPDWLKELIRAGAVGLANAAALSRLPPEELVRMRPQLEKGEIRRASLAQKRVRESGAAERLKRVNFETATATVSVASVGGVGFDSVIASLRTLTRECVKARREGIDVSTLALLLRDRAKGKAAEVSP